MDYRFCPVCGGDLAPQIVTLGDPRRPVCQRCGFVSYQNSKPCVGALLVGDDGRILLTRRAIPPFAGWWDLPGGFLELGEHPEGGLIRELQEETGLTVEPQGLIGIYMDQYGDGGDATLNLMYLARVVAGVLYPASDVDAIAWFRPNELPEDIAFTCNRRALDDWRKQLR